MKEKKEYEIRMYPAFDFLEVIDTPQIIANTTEKWFNQTLCKVNDSLLRLGIFEGEFHWHLHRNEDEVFFVLDGELMIETEKGTFLLKKYQGICIPKGLLHRPIAQTKTIVLMIEQSTVVPTGD